MKQGRPDPYILATVSKALEILDLFGNVHDGLSLTQIAEATQLPKSSIFRYLATLEEFNYLERDEKTERYHLGLKLLQLGALVAGRQDVRTIALPTMWQLRESFGETVNLAIPRNDKVIYLEILESQEIVKMATHVGAEDSIHATELVKAILAQLPLALVEKLLREPFARFTDYTITDMPTLFDQLEQIRQQGYALDDREGNMQARCVGAAIFDYRGQAVAAISVSGPENRLTLARARMMGPVLAEASSQISTLLGYRH